MIRKAAAGLLTNSGFPRPLASEPRAFVLCLVRPRIRVELHPGCGSFLQRNWISIPPGYRHVCVIDRVTADLRCRTEQAHIRAGFIRRAPSILHQTERD
jgi:hypothetical protein